MSKKPTTYQELLKELRERPFYHKWWSSVLLFHFECKSYVWHVLLGKPKHIEIIDTTINHIKDDIEFGYNLDMIYNKMLNGNYNNTIMSEKDNWFKKKDIN